MQNICIMTLERNKICSLLTDTNLHYWQNSTINKRMLQIGSKKKTLHKMPKLRKKCLLHYSLCKSVELG